MSDDHTLDVLPAGVSPLRSRDPSDVGSWRLTGRLGSGGMGTAYLATGEDGRWAIAKVVNDSLVDDPDARARFAREVEILRSLPASRTARVLDADLDADPPYLILEYVPGPTLEQHVEAYGPLSGRAATALAHELAAALATVHATGVVHRDVKPTNVIMSPDGIRLIDFGIAVAGGSTSLTRTGLVAGSPGWLAPEQLIGTGTGPATDMFGWAATVAYATTGRSPFGTADTAGAVYKVMHADPDLDGVPDELRPLLLACLAKDPAARPRAESVADAVTNGRTPAAGSSVGGPSAATDIVLAAPAVPARRRGLRRTGIVVIASATALAVAGIAGAAVTVLGGGSAASSVETATPVEDPEPPPETVAPPTITLDCYPQADATVPGRVRFDFTYQAGTDDFAVDVSYGDGTDFTASPDNVESAFWHEYPSEGDYGPVSAVITDANGTRATASCGTVYVPVGSDSVGSDSVGSDTGAPAPVADDASTSDVLSEPDGLFCRDLKDRGYSYSEAVDYWDYNGQPERMDAGNDGVPCTTVYSAQEVADYYGAD